MSDFKCFAEACEDWLDQTRPARTFLEHPDLARLIEAAQRQSFWVGGMAFAGMVIEDGIDPVELVREIRAKLAAADGANKPPH